MISKFPRRTLQPIERTLTNHARRRYNQKSARDSRNHSKPKASNRKHHHKDQELEGRVGKYIKSREGMKKNQNEEKNQRREKGNKWKITSHKNYTPSDRNNRVKTQFSRKFRNLIWPHSAK